MTTTTTQHTPGPRETDYLINQLNEARLIAAAPELLEALEALSNIVAPYIMQLPVKKGFSEMVRLEAARTAIAKAKGEQS